MVEAVEVRAPGKLVLVGEYAVLDGAPAVVAAVDRGVRCWAEPAATLEISTPGDDRFVRAALHGTTGQFRFEDWNPVDLASKPGLGGSAAAVVAAVLARAALENRALSPDQLRLEASRLHRWVQGSGSGIDVAASSHGGVLRFQSDRVTAMPDVDPVVVWSGQSARTGPRVERYLQWSGRAAFAAESEEIVEAFATEPIGALDAATALLDRMSHAAGVDWWTPELRQITALAREAGGAAKPSGAGGGDVAVALFPSATARSAFEAATAQAGLLVIPVRLAAGASVHR